MAQCDDVGWHYTLKGHRLKMPVILAEQRGALTVSFLWVREWHSVSLD
ncbi:hypothetical protein [Shewanella denitrificans]|nr:hypothetical protein [Shewanella denitrificans]